MTGFITRDATGDTDPAILSSANHAQLTARLSTMTGLAGYLDTSASIVAPGVDALYVDVSFVMHEYFRVLGLRMAAGRHFTAEDDRPAAARHHARGARPARRDRRQPGRTLGVLPGAGRARRIGPRPRRTRGTYARP